MPRTPLTPAEYLQFIGMITRIRTLEHVVTEHYFDGDPTRRTRIATKVTDKIESIQRRLFPVPNTGGAAAIAPTTQGPDFISQGRCTPPYCNQGNGTCELCDFDAIQQQLIAALARINQ